MEIQMANCKRAKISFLKPPVGRGAPSSTRNGSVVTDKASVTNKRKGFSRGELIRKEFMGIKGLRLKSG